MDKSRSFVSKISFNNSSGEPKIVSAKVSVSDDERLTGLFLNLEKYRSIDIIFFEYKLLDAAGNVNEEWEGPPTINGVSDNIDKLKFKNAGLDDDGEFYVLFKIFDLNNESHISKLMKVGK